MRSHPRACAFPLVQMDKTSAILEGLGALATAGAPRAWGPGSARSHIASATIVPPAWSCLDARMKRATQPPLQ
jgi:hypothetical protein